MGNVQADFGFGISIGVALGIIFGLMINNTGLGIALDAAFGLIGYFSTGRAGAIRNN